jgi:hypothetical protein
MRLISTSWADSMWRATLPIGVYISVQGSSGVRAATELAACSNGNAASANPSQRRIEVIKVPLANPKRVDAAPDPPVGVLARRDVLQRRPLRRVGRRHRRTLPRFMQTIGANDARLTGAYSKTLTFTLSTTQP